MSVFVKKVLATKCIFSKDDIVKKQQLSRARAQRALGLLLADGALTVGWGKTFWCVGRVPSRKRA